MKQVLSVLLAAALVVAMLTGCGSLSTTTPSDNPSQTSQSEPSGNANGGDAKDVTEPGNNETAPRSTDGYSPFVDVQGVTDKIIYVGNTSPTTGSWATVGVPFNAGIEAGLWAYNEAGGFRGKTIELIHYDDGFDAAQGLTYTQTLVEEDHIFALVGHFGTNTVGATLDYIKEKGIPMVYACTGVDVLYQENATGNNKVVYPVQPIYSSEGRVLLARAMASREDGVGLGGKKIGVIATTDDAGAGLLRGVKREAEDLKPDILYQEVDAAATDYSAAVNVLKNAGCDVVIGCMNQVPLSTLMSSMRDADYEVDVITSYVSASAPLLGALVDNGSITENRGVYTTAWLDFTTEQGWSDYLKFAEIMNAWELAHGYSGSEYTMNSYAMCGYIAAELFVGAMQKLDASGLELDWYNFNDVMEELEYHIPMGGTISYRDGARLGITDLALNTISPEADETGAHSIQAVAPIESIENVRKAIK